MKLVIAYRRRNRIPSHDAIFWSLLKQMDSKLESWTPDTVQCIFQLAFMDSLEYYRFDNIGFAYM